MQIKCTVNKGHVHAVSLIQAFTARLSGILRQGLIVAVSGHNTD